MPQQNGVAERRNMTLFQMVRSIMSYTSLSIFVGGYALDTVAYLLNRVPFKSVPIIPVELWRGYKLVLSHIRVWGFLARLLKGNVYMLESRTELCFFIGCPKGTRGNLFYDPIERRILMSTDVKFLEEDYITEYKPKSRIVLHKTLGVP